MSKNFDIVRISSHGEFINSVLYDERIINNEPKNIKFNIYFRGKIGSVVLTRCNTKDTKIIDGQSYCSSFIGRSDFHKNMVINYNDNGITSAIVMGCSAPLIPDMLLSFEDDEFVSGYALYHEGGVPLECDGNYIKMKLFQKNGVNQNEIKLSDVLKFIYDIKDVKTGVIDIYVSSCLYIEPNIINDIMKGYNEWFNCNRENIIIGYENVYNSNQKKINIDERKLEGLYIYNENLKNMNNDEKLQYYVDILSNTEFGFENFVYNYLKTEKEQIDEIEQLIIEYMDTNDINVDENWTPEMYKQKSEEISNAVKNIFIEKINDVEQKELNKNEIDNNIVEINQLTESINKLKMENLEINNAINVINANLVKKQNKNDKKYNIGIKKTIKKRGGSKKRKKYKKKNKKSKKKSHKKRSKTKNKKQKPQV